VERFRTTGGSDKPVVGEITVCFGSDTERALELAADGADAGIPG